VSRSNIELKGNSALTFLLGINSVVSNPAEIDLSTVNPVIDMGMSGYSYLHDSTRYLSLFDGAGLAGLQTKTMRILTQGNAFGANPQLVYPIGCHFVVFSCTFTMVVDAAGAAAINNKYIIAALEMGLPNTSIVTKKWRGQITGDTACKHYFDGMQRVEKINRDHLYILPSGSNLSYVIYVDDGTNFPANTTFEYHLTGMAVPVGAPLPLDI